MMAVQFSSPCPTTRSVSTQTRFRVPTRVPTRVKGNIFLFLPGKYFFKYYVRLFINNFTLSFYSFL